MGYEDGLAAKVEQQHLSVVLFEQLGELLPEVVHCLAELHDRDHLRDLVVDLIATKCLEPLVVILQEPRVWVFLPQLFADVFVDSVIDEHHHVLAPPEGQHEQLKEIMGVRQRILMQRAGVTTNVAEYESLTAVINKARAEDHEALRNSEQLIDLRFKSVLNAKTRRDNAAP